MTFQLQRLLLSNPSTKRPFSRPLIIVVAPGYLNGTTAAAGSNQLQEQRQVLPGLCLHY